MASSANRRSSGCRRPAPTGTAGWPSWRDPNSNSSEDLHITQQHGINRIARRDFVKAGLIFGAGAGALAAGYAAVPDAFARAIYALKRAGGGGEAVRGLV